MALFTPSEAVRLQTFLSHVEYNDSFNPSSEWAFYTDKSITQVAEGKEELAKATRNLMALDSTPSSSSANANPGVRWAQQHPQQGIQPGALQQPPVHPPRSPQLFQPPPYFHPAPIGPPLPRASSSSSPTPITIAPGATKKRPSASEPPAPAAKKRSRSATNSTKPIILDAPPIPSSSSAPVVTTKATLLTPSQKKANHIHSEQKRRANIRKGYDALCETIPPLREAIRLEEENNSAVASGKKRSRGKVGEDGEKIDGRAGPRSESVVLTKTIDYLTNLAERRAALKSRLEHVRNLLPSHHPAIAQTQYLVDLKWDGGTGQLDGEDEAEGGSDDEEDD